MLKKSILLIPAWFGLGLFLKYLGVVLTVVLNWQNSELVTFSSKFDYGNEILDQYNLLIFTVSVIPIGLIVLLDKKGMKELDKFTNNNVLVVLYGLFSVLILMFSIGYVAGAIKSLFV